jgi:hypothetical protein
MKTTILISSLLLALPAAADTYVRPHINKDGEYVEGHFRTKSNSTKLDNYSTKGNTNPYTGKKGTVDPYDLDESLSSRSKRSSTYEYKPYTYDSNPYGSSSRSKKRGY